MKAKNVNQMKNICTEKKNMLRYMKSICCVVFCGLCEDACPKDAIYLTTPKELVALVMKEKILFMKR
jgi:NADH-quinone oxidoreductase subunit I